MNPNSSYFNFKTSNSTSKVQIQIQNSKFQIPKSKSKNPNSKFWTRLAIHPGKVAAWSPAAAHMGPRCIASVSIVKNNRKKERKKKTEKKHTSFSFF